MWWLSAWRRRRALRKPGFTPEHWRAVAADVALLQDWDADTLERLRELVILFLHAKVFSAAGGEAVPLELRLKIAAQACVPILNLGLDYYAGWVELIIYPDAFVSRHEEMDEAGVLHSWRRPLSGEAWPQGPVVLSRADVEESARWRDGFNVVIHEMAHKLDMLNGGDANGFPPLHRGMRAQDWATRWSSAYADFCRRADAEEDTLLDPYAADSPAEFFAVMSEAFFEVPEVVKAEFAPLYPLLSAFYRSDPLPG